MRPYAAGLLAERLALLALIAAAGLIERLLPEREPHPETFEKFHKLIETLGIRLCESFSTVHQYKTADEVFLAGTTTEAMPVIRVDDVTIGDGTPGPITRRIRQAFVESVRSR